MWTIRCRENGDVIDEYDSLREALLDLGLFWDTDDCNDDDISWDFYQLIDGDGRDIGLYYTTDDVIEIVKQEEAAALLGTNDPELQRRQARRTKRAIDIFRQI